LFGNIIPRQIASASNFPVNFAFLIDVISNGKAYEIAIAVAPRVAPVAAPIATAASAVIYAVYTTLTAT
jgi:hypothetical protein